MTTLETIVIWNLPKNMEKEVRTLFIDKCLLYSNEGYSQEKARRMARNDIHRIYYREIIRR